MPGGERSSTLWRCFSRSCRTEEPQFPSPLPPDPTDLLFSGLERLLKGALQTIYAGKAHPADQGEEEIPRGTTRIAMVMIVRKTPPRSTINSKDSHPALLQRTRPFNRRDASLHRAQRLILQHSPNGAAICAEGLLRVRDREFADPKKCAPFPR